MQTLFIYPRCLPSLGTSSSYSLLMGNFIFFLIILIPSLLLGSTDKLRTDVRRTKLKTLLRLIFMMIAIG